MTGYVTDDYAVVVADKEEDGKILKVYRVQNSEHEVIEYEDYLLPRTIDTMLEMQVRYNEVKVKYNTPNAPDLHIVGDDDGEVPIH